MLGTTTITIIFVLMWTVGLVAAYTLGGLLNRLMGERRGEILVETISEE